MSLRAMMYCPMLVVLAVCCGCGRTTVAKDLKGPFKKLAESKDVAWLEEVASSLDKAEAQGPEGHLGTHAKDLRTDAYARLGALGTEASLAAANRVEEGAKGFSLTPDTVSLSLWTHPAWHCGDGEVKPLVSTKAADGTTYALVRSCLLGEWELFLISTKTPDDPASWTRPRPACSVACWTIRDPSLSTRDERIFDFSYSEAQEVTQADGTVKRPVQWELRKHEIDLAQGLRDQDGDGWTDIEEAKLGLDAEKVDTDGDGVADGLDCCPNYAPAQADLVSEEACILQRAIFATFGLSGSRCLLIVGAKSPKVQAWGYQGPIIYPNNPDDWAESHGVGGVFVNWSLTRRGNRAEVVISDYEGPLAGGCQYVHLKKIKGRWTVTKREFGYVS